MMGDVISIFGNIFKFFYPHVVIFEHALHMNPKSLKLKGGNRESRQPSVEAKQEWHQKGSPKENEELSVDGQS